MVDGSSSTAIKLMSARLVSLVFRRSVAPHRGGSTQSVSSMPAASSRLRLCLLALAAAPPPALACTTRAGDTAVSDRKQENSKNPFKVQLERRFKFRNFDPPQKVLYGFKPVNILKTFLDDVPGIKL